MLKNRHIYAMLRPTIRFIKFRILHVDDSPTSLSMGVAMGIFIAWTPTIGLHMLTALALSFLFKANKFLAVSFVWISNIFTLIPIYLPSYMLGKYILSLFSYNDEVTKSQVIELLRRLGAFSVIIDIWTVDFWKNTFDILLKIGFPLLTGCTIIGLIVSIISYVLTYKLIIWYRTKHPHKRYSTQNDK